MTWLSRVAQMFRPKAANSITTAADLQELIDTALGGMSSSGLRVGAAQAVQQAAVSSALLVLGETLAQLPFDVMRRQVGGGNQVVEDHPVQRLLSRHGHPNAWMTSFEFRELAVRHVATRGNFFAFKNSARGVLRELLPIHPKRVQAELDDEFRIRYRVNMRQGGRRTFGPAEILHLRGPSDDGFLGLDRMQQHKDTIGLGLAQDMHAGKVFANGARIAGVLERLDSISSPADLRQAGYRVHRLTGDRKGSHAVRISGAWRVVFRFQDGNAYDVEAVDYHRS